MDDERLESLKSKVSELKAKHEQALKKVQDQENKARIIEANLRAYSHALAQAVKEVAK